MLRLPLALISFVLLAAYGFEERPKNQGACFQVWYDAGGARRVATARVLRRVSDTHVVLKQVVLVGGSSHAYDDSPVEITSHNIVIREGSCFPL
jgi:hypothetical protein